MEINTPKDIAAIREPVSKEDRELISSALRRGEMISEMMDTEKRYFIGESDRSFDKVSDVYGDSFHDFTVWPNSKPMNEQVAAEYFIIICFTDTVIRMYENNKLTGDEAESIIWMAKKGLLATAAAIVSGAMRQRRDADDDAW